MGRGKTTIILKSQLPALIFLFRKHAYKYNTVAQELSVSLLIDNVYMQPYKALQALVIFRKKKIKRLN